jgi:hypothetical protein
MIRCSVFQTIESPEGVLHVEEQLADALPDVLQRTVRVVLLVEQVGVEGIHHDLQRSHVHDPVVQVLVQPRHLVEQEQLVHVH